MVELADVVIVGGGVTGCALAYFLAQKRVGKVVLLERQYLGSGATGRCMGGIRQQFSVRSNIRTAMESVAIYTRLYDEIGIDVEYRQGGYLILAETEKRESELKADMCLQRSMGLGTEYISRKDIIRLAPVVSVDNVLGATYCSTDGHANPFKTVHAFATGARRLGADVRPHTEVIDISVDRDRVQGVRSSSGEVKTDIVVNAGGPWAKAIGRMGHVDLPVQPFRHQLLVTEPVQHVMDPLVISMHGGGRQTAHGEFLLNCQQRNDVEGLDFSSSFEYLRDNARAIMRVFPGLGSLRVLRQWAGQYTMTPDANPVVGESDEVRGFIHVCGYSGHGFMIAPRIAELVAHLIVTGERPAGLDAYDLKRFDGRPVGSTEANVFGLDRTSQ